MPTSQAGISFYHPNGHLARPSNPFGKDIANAALFRGLAQHGGFAEVAVLNQAGLTAEQLTTELALNDQAAASTSVSAAPLWDTQLPKRTGALLRGQPLLEELAWIRRSAGLDQAYSLLGLIHSIAPPASRDLIGAAALAPTHPWDALICTSPSVQQAMEEMFDRWAEHLTARLGAQQLPRPQLPLIPLAVDVDALQQQRRDLQARSALRQRLGVANDAVLVLWVGRLSYFEKAFPQSMFQAVARAAERSGQKLHLALVGWFPGGNDDMRRYQQAAEQLAPQVPVAVLDGNNPQTVAQSWAAADLFISLVDNIQETFGLTPVEAMAAGVPVVVSDWDGYRYTVRDGVDGFRIPTLASPGGAPGELLAHLHGGLRLETYQTYVGAVAQHTAVHIDQAAAAIARLAAAPELRQSMGAAAQLRAQSLFSWPQVARQYSDLLAELAQRRRHGDALQASAGARLQPLRGEPFRDFRGFATHVLSDDLKLRLADGAAADQLEQALAIELNRMYPGVRASNSQAQALLQQLQNQPTGLTVAALLADASIEQRGYLETTLVWLAKLGLIDWLPPGE